MGVTLPGWDSIDNPSLYTTGRRIRRFPSPPPTSMRLLKQSTCRPVKDHHTGILIMPSRNGNSNPSRQVPRRSTSQPAEGTRGRTARSLITFVDSQDPNSRSAIQRHTAFHSNQQRRDARLQSLRTTSRPRLLEWQRRSESAAPSQTSSNSSSSRSLLATHDRGRGSHRQSPEDINFNEEVVAAVQEDPPPSGSPSASEQENLIQYFLGATCSHAENRQAYEDVVRFIREDSTCTYFLMAYALALRAHNLHSLSVTADCDRGRELHARGTTSLRNRLSYAVNAASDQSIQAVLLLIAYTADFRTLEDVSIHARALGTMVEQRGGTDEGSFPPALPCKDSRTDSEICNETPVYAFSSDSGSSDYAVP